MGIKDYIPTAYYSDGTESKCWIYKICDMFDVSCSHKNSYNNSFKVVMNIKDMNKKKEEETRASFGEINRLISDSFIPNWGPELDAKTGKLVDI